MSTAFLKVIQNKQFTKLWLGQIISQIALNMLSFVLAIQVYTQTHSNIAVSLMLLMFGLPSILFGVVAGSLVDHFDKRAIMIFCNVSRAFLLVLFFLTIRQPIYFLYVLTIIISLITQLFIPAEGPSIPLLVKPDELLAANSLFTISFYLSTVIGFILAGPAVYFLGDEYVFLAMAILLAIASYFVYRLPPLSHSKSKEPFTILVVWTTMKDGFTFIKDHQRIKQSLFLMTFAQSLISTLAVLAPGFADRVLSIRLTDASFLVMGPAALGLVVGAYIVGGLGNKVLKGKLILWGIIANGLTLLLLSILTSRDIWGLVSTSHSALIVSPLLLSVILLVILGISNSLISVPANTILQGDSDATVRGRVYGVLTSATGGVSLIPVLLSGILADVSGVTKTLGILGCCILGIGLYQLQKRRSFEY